MILKGCPKGSPIVKFEIANCAYPLSKRFNLSSNSAMYFRCRDIISPFLLTSGTRPDTYKSRSSWAALTVLSRFRYLGRIFR
ncbi:hypothetical protein SAMN05421747_12360 [Parapedobacter composti]|uniref:Uncharacterized protein n=1 Tax=Parapedobacter composti TaxID=623281 RepID=A0A1I1LS62_9SPHI|nr:hypothetical protein SAMN05421747_12360 [Parapedobacter composti]